MDRRRFRRLVAEALDTLPAEVRVRMENVTVFVEDQPTEEQISGAGVDPHRDVLFGLYEGLPLGERDHDYGMALPDRITLFYRPLVEAFRSPVEIREEIRRTIVHEVAHFIGLDDEDIEGRGY